MKAIHAALLQLEKEAKPYTVVQIGAYVGNSPSDPLWEHFSKPCRGRLVAVEPIKEYYDQLVANYAHAPWVRCEQFAVSEDNGMADMFRIGVKPELHGYPEWLSQLSSLKQERMEELWDGFEGNTPAVEFTSEFYLKHRTTESVFTITLASLIKRCRLKSIDLLVIDVEGYEAEILDQVDFPVRYLQYEYCLLPQHEDVRILFEMEAKGYLSTRCGQDTFCWQAGDAVEGMFAEVLEKRK